MAKTKARKLLSALLDLSFFMLPAAILIAFIDYTAWCAWWI